MGCRSEFQLPTCVNGQWIFHPESMHSTIGSLDTAHVWDGDVWDGDVWE